MITQTIALVIKTDGLEYDDRVRKEILSIQKLYPNITFKIFVLLPLNIEEEGITSYGVPYKSIYIPARDKYPSAQKTTLKAWQFYQAVKKEIKTYDAIWVTDVEVAFIPMLLKHKRILWDLHELPQLFLRTSLKRLMLRYIFNRCKVILHANPQREKYLESIGVIKDPSKHFSLRNYPNFEDVDTQYDSQYYSFIKWKSGRKCVYLQGLTNDCRAPFESISAVMSIPNICAVVVGGFDINIKKRLEDNYGDELHERILFVGKIPQLKIPQYIKQCFTTLVFYKNISPNNYYCEANRFYQSIILGLPVVVGNNPSMKELVNQYMFGISVEDDGKDIQKMIHGLNEIITNYDYYCQNALTNRDKLLWNNQEPVIRAIINELQK